ncbi:MAG: hypothetical protein QM661_15890, partial [Solimonas sp.]
MHPVTMRGAHGALAVGSYIVRQQSNQSFDGSFVWDSRVGRTSQDISALTHSEHGSGKILWIASYWQPAIGLGITQQRRQTLSDPSKCVFERFAQCIIGHYFWVCGQTANAAALEDIALASKIGQHSIKRSARAVEELPDFLDQFRG